MIVNIFIALAIILVLIGVCLFFAIKMNKIYSSNDKHFGKLASNEKAYDLTKEKDKEEVKDILFTNKDDTEILDNYGYIPKDKLIKSKQTIRISEVAEAFHLKYDGWKEVNVKYAFMKLAKLSEINDVKPIRFKKIGKTFYLSVRNILDLKQCIKYIPKNETKYSRHKLNCILETASVLLLDKITAKKFKQKSPNDMLDRF